jgi:hypothetical protein
LFVLNARLMRPYVWTSYIVAIHTRAGMQKVKAPDDLRIGIGHSVNWDALRSASATKSKGPGDEIRQPQAKPTFTITVQDMQLFLRSIAPLANKAQEKNGEPNVPDRSCR